MSRMREIKFRAWDKKRKVMIDVRATFTHGQDPIVEGWHPTEGYAMECSIKDCELMQFTGLKDENGKEIYEGDIVKEDDNEIRTIVWENGSFFRRENMVGHIKTLYFKGEVEVIGNIYENPELIK